MSKINYQFTINLIRSSKHCQLLQSNQLRFLSTSPLPDNGNNQGDDVIADLAIPKTLQEYRQRKCSPIVQPKDARLNRVAIIGLPNAGKSTLVNALTGHRIASVSKKVNTTRRNIIGVFSEGSTQVELLDTPGLVELKHCVQHNLEHTLFHAPRLSAKVVDLIAVLVDASLRKYRNFLALETFKILSKHRDKKSILILNKVDQVAKKHKLLEIVDNLTGGCINGESIEGREKVVKKFEQKKTFKDLIEKMESKNELSNQENIEPKLDTKNDLFNLYWPYFSRVFMVSALTGDGVGELKDYLIETAPLKPWKYHESVITNQDPFNLALSIVREKFLDNCCWDIPYTLKFIVDTWEVDELDNLHIAVRVLCPKDNSMAFLIGGDGQTISKISTEARQELMDTFHCDIRLKIIVQCTEKTKKK